MDQHEIDAELALAGAQELLHGTSLAHLSYLAPDGTPRVVPVGSWWTGTELVVSTATTAPKAAALRANPAVAVALDSGGTPDSARSLSLRGRAELTVVDGVVPEYLAAARRSMDPDAYAGFEEAVRGFYPQMVRIGIRPTWARFHDYGTGRVPTFLRELAERAGG
jgi:hypothetical protein